MRIDVRRGEPLTPPPAPVADDARRGHALRGTRSVMCIVGTRPEVIKMAPMIRALRSAPALAVSLLSSGQHRDLLAPLVNWFELSIDADLQVMTQDQSLAELTARLMQGFAQRFAAKRPDLVLAQGDTTTVLCAALSCFYLDIPFGHVEAGLRTFQPRNPFPEEFNRVAVGRLARLHFCPTPRARQPARRARRRQRGAAHGQHRDRRAAIHHRQAREARAARLRPRHPAHRAPARELRRAAHRDLPRAARAMPPLPAAESALPGAP